MVLVFLGAERAESVASADGTTSVLFVVVREVLGSGGDEGEDMVGRGEECPSDIASGRDVSMSAMVFDKRARSV